METLYQIARFFANSGHLNSLFGMHDAVLDRCEFRGCMFYTAPEFAIEKDKSGAQITSSA
ncbi:hypothetical protein A3H75_01625 [Candidatus Uhrbacteria bacterium RIFCSPLOWO2_02_FULL_51_9]|uniref:Uncharacterized protein n=1 Tax=Candidatus Uhrbacteria bacterium RIFCSPLOWO2_02_FULL_51_9 TaxID=1802410 RepID=A0A1F7VFU9_9BACT|nr:MAG: hypothetical protein A3H75_01625 [Candidatus Uhrbacteria bacterium RIFCSPLOWO2_02_FULL_51_9]